jgi:uncharacterized protein YlzI (FlbEa/FlbD family)
LIEFLDEMPDTMACTTTGKKALAKESVEEIVEQVFRYRRRCSAAPQKIRKSAFGK